MNLEHGRDGSGWVSDRQGSCKCSGSSLKTQSGQRHWLLRLGQAETIVEAQSGLSEA